MNEWTKRCKRCKCEHDIDAFPTDNGWDYGDICVPCLEAAEEESRLIERRTTTGKFQMERLYGVSNDTYDLILKEQGFKCKLCGIEQEKLGRKLDVDHNHANGNVRGLLCNKCNTTLAKYKDDQLALEEEGLYEFAEYVYDDGAWLKPFFEKQEEIYNEVIREYKEAKKEGGAAFRRHVLFHSVPRKRRL